MMAEIKMIFSSMGGGKVLLNTDPWHMTMCYCYHRTSGTKLKFVIRILSIVILTKYKENLLRQ